MSSPFGLAVPYREVLKSDLPWLDGLTRPKKPVRLPVVLTEQEVRALLAELSGVPWLVAGLLYGAGYGCWKRCAFG